MAKNLGIRDAVLKCGDSMSTQDVIATLAKQGIEVNANYIYTIRSDYRKKHGLRAPSRRRGPGRLPKTEAAPTGQTEMPDPVFSISVDSAISAKRLSDKKKMSTEEIRLAAIMADIGLTRSEEIIQGLRTVAHSVVS